MMNLDCKTKSGVLNFGVPPGIYIEYVPTYGTDAVYPHMEPVYRGSAKKRVFLRIYFVPTYGTCLVPTGGTCLYFLPSQKSIASPLQYPHKPQGERGIYGPMLTGQKPLKIKGICHA
jgi:hypothetical protein